MPRRRRQPPRSARRRTKGPSKAKKSAHAPRRSTSPSARRRSATQRPPETLALTRAHAAVLPVAPALVGTALEVRRIVFVHGVEWEADVKLKGFSRPLQETILRDKSPGIRLECVEALWSDVVEPTERALIASGEIAFRLIAQDYVGAARTFVDVLGTTLNLGTGFGDKLLEKALDQVLPKQSIPLEGMLTNLLSAVLDVVLYLIPTYGQRIRAKVRADLEEAGGQRNPPIVYAHSLGAMIILDILREDIARGEALTVGPLVTAGTPIGLFQPNRDSERLADVGWVDFWDASDFLTVWCPLTRFGYKQVACRRIETSTLPLISHVGYWNDGSVARELIACL